MIALAQEIEWPEAIMWIGIAFACAIAVIAACKWA